MSLKAERSPRGVLCAFPFGGFASNDFLSHNDRVGSGGYPSASSGSDKKNSDRHDRTVLIKTRKTL
ncbi:hypothetical protein HJC23_001066 [Cyclotella cryptica]|uniref:Uncharacterized protein n=1 Tax=Cyclotella cryptica TaxID=29204 RepID=A0ABD3QQJ0_9STRA